MAQHELAEDWLPDSARRTPQVQPLKFGVRPPDTMKIVDTLVSLFSTGKKLEGNLGAAILEIYKQAGATLNHDFEPPEIMTKWRYRADELAEGAQHLFCAAQDIEPQADLLFENLYGNPSHASDEGKIFDAPNQKNAPTAILVRKNKTLMIFVYVPKRDGQRGRTCASS